jgi:hypothetical protein
MFCSGCGQPLAPYQQACAHCGKPAIPPMSPVSHFPSYSRVQRHMHTLAILWLVYSIFAILAWFIAIPFLGFIFAHGGHGMFHGDFPFPMSMGWIIPFITIVIYIRSGLGLLVGIGLLRREKWARPLALVVGILMLLKVPFGTALGIYTLWVLAPVQSGQEYDMVAVR